MAARSAAALATAPLKRWPRGSAPDRFAADINDPVELAPIHSGLFNACLTHGEIAPMRELVEAIMGAVEQRPELPVAAIVARYSSGVTRWFAGDYRNAQTASRAGARDLRAEPDPAAFKARRRTCLPSSCGFCAGALAARAASIIAPARR